MWAPVLLAVHQRMLHQQTGVPAVPTASGRSSLFFCRPGCLAADVHIRVVVLVCLHARVDACAPRSSLALLYLCQVEVPK